MHPLRTIFGYFIAICLITILHINQSQADQTAHVYGLYDRTHNKVALINASVVTEPGNLIEQGTVIIDNGKILSVGKTNDIPKDARIIDLNGYWVYAGFIDPYSDYVFGGNKSYPAWGDPPKYEGDRKGGNAWNDAIHAQINWVDTFKADKEQADTLIKNGFTSVQTARKDGIFQGRAVTVSLADDVPNNLIYNAKSRHFGSFNKGSSKQSYPSSLMGSIALIRQTLSDVNWYQQATGKTDALFTQDPVEYNAALSSLASLKTEGIVFEGGDSLSTLRAHRLFSAHKIDAAYVGDGLEYSRLKQIEQTNATLILPLNFPKAPILGSFESQLDTSLAELRHFERAPSNPAALEKAGIQFAFTQHGLKDKKDFWTVLNKAVKHGLSESTALAALTTVPAKIAGISGIAGKLISGYRADLVIADGNLFDGGKVVEVFLQGRSVNLKDFNQSQFEAKYNIALNDQDYRLTLTQKKDKVTGSIKQVDSDKKAIDIANVNIQGDQISFTVELGENTNSEVFSFTGRLINNNLVGTWLKPDFSRVAVVATINDNATKDSKDDDAKKDTPEILEYVSTLTYPNRAFGLNGLPDMQNLHIKNATIWTSEDEGVLENADMIVRDGKIREIGENLTTPRGFTVIDATDKHVTAGIIDEHSHIAISGGVNEGSDAITAEVRIADVINPEDINIYRALAGGTTAAQLLHGSANPVGGQAQVIKMRWGTDSEGLKMQQAPPSIKFALGENVKQSNWGDKFTIRYPQTRMGVDTIVRDSLLRAREYKDSFEQYDELSRKDKRIIAPPRLNYRLDALVEIMDNQRFIHAHSYVASEILALMELAEDFGFKIQTFTHILEGYKVAEEMAKHGASASSFADWWAYKFEVIDAIPSNTCLMMDKGVNVSVNSDSGDLIRRLNTEAAKSINYCDMSEADAIKMVTINPAIQLKIDEYTGSLKKGKDADFVIWNGHPLSIYSKVEQTWIEGRQYFDIAKDAQKRQALAMEKSQLIQKFLSSSEGYHKNGQNKSSPNQFASYVNSLRKVANKSHTHVSYSTIPAHFDSYLLKDNTVWHCEDNFDYWHYISGAKYRAHSGGHH